jgi:hypothetical protein
VSSSPPRGPRPASPLLPCRTCGVPPLAGVQVANGHTSGWFTCPECGVRTRDNLPYDDAWVEWNQLYGGIHRPS